jgi:hypothetical protein
VQQIAAHIQARVDPVAADIAAVMLKLTELEPVC